jgi:hypothetical protein
MAIVRRRQRAAVEPRVVFQQCPGCAYDFVAGTGTRACGWYDCPYLPEELKVNCPECNYNFASGEGAPWCGEPPSCQWAAEGRRHAENARRLQRSGADS